MGRPPHGFHVSRVHIRGGPGSMMPCSAAALEGDRLEKCIRKWLHVAHDDLQEHSQLLQQVSDARHPEAHARQAVAGFPSSTLARHLGAWEQWSSWRAGAGINAGVLYELTMGSARDRGRNRRKSVLSAITGMRFAARCARAHSLLQSLESLCAQGYLDGSALTCDRRESLPLPLAVIATLERQVASRNCPEHERIFLGTMCAAIWGGLRVSDMQRTAPSTLVLDGDSMRGVCWITKTSRAGQPFGAHAYGFIGRPPLQG
jgi:hypothetical protein